LATNSKSVPFPQHDTPTHKHLISSLVFGHVGEYSRATCTLAPFSPAPMSSNTTSAFIALHPESNGYFSLFLEDYEPNQDLELSFDSFKLTFQHMPHKLASGFFGMVLKHFQNCFHLEDLVNGFPLLFDLCFHIGKSHISL